MPPDGIKITWHSMPPDDKEIAWHSMPPVKIAWHSMPPDDKEIAWHPMPLDDIKIAWPTKANHSYQLYIKHHGVSNITAIQTSLCVLYFNTIQLLHFSECDMCYGAMKNIIDKSRRPQSILLFSAP